MRVLRCFAYFLIGFLLSVCAGLSYADTYPAVKVWIIPSWPSDGTFADQGAACTKYKTHTSWTAASAGPTIYNCAYSNWQGTSGFVSGDVLNQQYSCPNGGTLSGTTCTKTCPAGQQLKEDGTCGCPAGQAWSDVKNQCVSVCDAYKGVDNLEGVMLDPSKFKPYCDANSCAWVFSRSEKCATKSGDANYCSITSLGTAWPAYHVWSKGAGLCSDVSVTGDKSGSGAGDTKPTNPVCPPGYGVMTSSSGTVGCVPPGTPSSNTPVVDVTKKTETFGDGSTKLTETTQTKDPSTQATDTRQTTTVTAATGGGAGQAGTPGTSTSSTSTSTTGGGGNGSGGGGDGSCDPTLNFCGGPPTEGLYEKGEKTAQSVMQKFVDDVKGTQSGQAVGSFFTVTGSGGSCPSWTANVDYLHWSLDLGQYFCTQAAINWLDTLGSVVLIVVSYVAFTWVLL